MVENASCDRNSVAPLSAHLIGKLMHDNYSQFNTLHSNIFISRRSRCLYPPGSLRPELDRPPQQTNRPRFSQPNHALIWRQIN